LFEPHLDSSYLNKLIESTIEAVEKSQVEIYNISEHANQECERLIIQLEDVKQKVKDVIKKVDKLQKQEVIAKHRLMIVSKNLKNYGEEDIKDAYEKAKNIQLDLMLEKEREAQLRLKRNEIEKSYRNMSRILRQSEHLNLKVGVVLNYLKTNLKGISKHLSGITQKEYFAEQIIRAQEEERKRISRDIHDGPAQMLANMIIQIELCERICEDKPEHSIRELKELKHKVRSSLKEIRKIIFDLRPSALDDLGLESVVQRYCAEFQEETGINTVFKMLGDRKRADGIIEVTLFRIIQEALSNIKKHSGAKNVLVRLELKCDKIRMIVSDDGRGFEFDRERILKTQDHFGIVNIKERVELLGGSVEIKTSPGAGTSINVMVPLSKS
jgi:two-component system sensor histidine kinase DegS